MKTSKEAITKANKILHDLNFEKGKTTTQIVAEGLESYATQSLPSQISDEEIEELAEKYREKVIYETRSVMYSMIDFTEGYKQGINRTALPREGEKRPKIICICGSSRFCADIAVIKWEFEKQGNIAVGLHLLPNSYTFLKDHVAEAQGVAEILDELHLRKIDLADEVFIANVNGYIGERTAIEIEYAKEKGKPIKYFESPKPPITDTTQEITTKQ